VTGRLILHVDMDAFYASVEVLQNPSLKGKPVIVGGSAERGVVASCSYEARAFGVKSAMSSWQAKRLCPTAIWVSGDHALYGEYSMKVHECFHRVTPLVEGIALDEAFLDATGAQRLLGDIETIAHDLRADVLHSTGLRCSVGIASSKLLAKLASEMAKPTPPGKPPRILPPGCRTTSAGVVRVSVEGELAFLHAHPIEALWGVGPATKERLARHGIRTIGDLAATPLDAVGRSVGAGIGGHLHQLAQGIDDRPVEPDRTAKSVGHEETFSTDRRDLDGLGVDIVRMSDAVSNRMREGKVVGRTVTLKLKFADFRLITRSKSIPVATRSGVRIADVARALLLEPETIDLVQAHGIRLLGVSMASLSESDGEGGGSVVEVASSTDVQLDLFAPPAEPSIAADDALKSKSAAQSRAAFDEAIAAVRERFGDGAVAPASLATDRGLRVKRRGDTQWGPSETNA
jgi:DNA polymerase IV